MTSALNTSHISPLHIRKPMAEYLLGLMLVAQSSRDRHVFRYPPDPTSPSDRLSQPIYSRATYTAQDNTVDRSMNAARLFSRRDGPRRSGRLGAFSGGGVSGFSGGLDEGSLARSMTGRSGSAHSFGTDNMTPIESSSSNSDDSDIDTIWGPSKYHSEAHHGKPHHPAGNHATHPPRRYSSESEGRSGLVNSVTKGFTEIKPNPNLDRRGSVISTETAKKKHHVTPLEQQYNFSMGYSLEFLSDLLSPRRAACNRKFSITINELIFMGHPVTAGPDGKWAYPAGDSDDDEDDRLRGRRKEAGPVKAVEEIQKEETPKNGRKDQAGLTLFHLVLILDKPDPKPGQVFTDCLDILYREVAFKWTAAAFALQVKDNWVGREIKKLMAIREKAMADGIPVNECLRICIEKSQLAQSLHELYGTLHKIKSRPLNGHFSRVSTTIKVPVGPIPITLVVPPITTDAEQLMVDRDGDSDSDLDSWEFAGPDGALIAKQPGFRVEPWKTLLLLDEDEVRPRRRREQERKHAEEEELVDLLVSHCDVSKPLHEIAHLMRCDLEGVVIPLARELVQNKRAVFIDVVNIRLRTILMSSTIVDHSLPITHHSVRFSVAFPKLPPLIPLLTMISAAPVPFRNLLPVEALNEPVKRDPWIRAVAWLLRNDLVIQAHVRARVIASASVKEAAWLKLWHRRRRRWLRERKMSVASGGSARSRPSFGEGSVGSGNAIAVNAAIATSPDRDGWAARVPKTPLAVTRTLSVGETADAESEYDLDSDDGLDDDGDGDEESGAAGRWRLLRPPLGPGIERCLATASYSLDEPEPVKTPMFGASFIFHPAQAQKDEARWLRVVRERTPDPVLRSRFDLCVQYFDGVTTFEEIVFRTGLTRRELDRIAMVYRDDLMITIHS
ncbi:hypothetical protein CcaverHIS631_0505480 [Cutaneotrichosporon cavernicola]|nr:hypothetical protein CcaverHIS631_0505480 [Cutaneotrichosporon cavernicola]